jgi:predicted phage tail protein
MLFILNRNGVPSIAKIIRITAASNLAPPSALTAQAISSSQIGLAWTDASNNETGFKISRSLNGTTFAQIATTGANITSYNDTGLAAGTTYYYRVRATNSIGDSAASNIVSATTLAAPLWAPGNLVATAVSATQINLTWTDLSSSETGVKVERSLNGTSFTQIATAGANATGFSDMNVTSKTKYYYRVRAYNASGNSGYSNTASVTSP